MFEYRQPLSGENHRALIDNRQLVLFSHALKELPKPPSERAPDWLETLKKMSIGDGECQASIKDYFILFSGANKVNMTALCSALDNVTAHQQGLEDGIRKWIETS